MTEFYVVRRGSTSLSNRVILTGLSYEALGLLMTELSLRPGSPLGYRNMIKPGCGETRVRKAHRELEAAGFRHRVLVRAADGLLKTVTVITDESMPTREVLAEIDLPEGDFVVKIQTDEEPVVPKFERPRVEGTGRQTASSHRAVPSTARCEQEECGTEEKTEKKQNTRSDRAVVSTARSTAARSTVPRLSTAGRSPNTLRVKDYPPSPLPPTETQPRDDDPAGDGRASRVDGAVAPGMEDHNSDTMTASPEEASGKADTTLIDRCLPPEMRRGLAPRHREQLARMLAERLAKGWSEQAICETLASRELPPQVRSLYGLVRARLERDVPPDSPVAPVSCDDSAAGQTVPVYRRSDGSAVPGWAICWGDVTVEWGSAQAGGQCGPDVSKQAWLSTQDCDRFIDELKLRRGRRA